MRSQCFGLLRPVVLLVPLMAAACGGAEEQDTPDEAAPEVSLEELDACALLTAEEIESATGHTPGDGSDPLPGASGAAPACVWPSADGSVSQVVQVLVAYATSDTFEEYRDARAEEGITEFSQIEGAGRFTVLLDGVNMTQTFGERFMVQIMVEPTEGTDAAVAATSLARAALGRLE